MAVRLADIARSAGVSEATVSRVLHERPGVAPATQQAVLTALDVLGYERPARLRRTEVGLIGLILPALGEAALSRTAQTVQSVLVPRGLLPVLCVQTTSGVTEEDYVDMLLDRGVAGIVFVAGPHTETTTDAEHYEALVRRRLPMVFLGGSVPGLDAPFFSADEAAGLDQAVGHLVALGHRRIGLAVGPRWYVVTERMIDGYRAAMRTHLGMRVDEAMIESTLSSVEGGAQAAGRLVARGATAVVCASDAMALGAIRAVRGQGLQVPRDVSVVGHDDARLMGFTDPALTTLRQQTAAAAQAAVETLLAQIGGQPRRTGEFLFRPELVVRGSTGPQRAPARR